MTKEGLLMGVAMFTFVTAIAYALGCVAFVSFNIADWSAKGRHGIAAVWAFSSIALTLSTVICVSEATR